MEKLVVGGIDVGVTFEVNDFDRHRAVADRIIVQPKPDERAVGFANAARSARPDLVQRIVRLVGNHCLLRQGVARQLHARTSEPDQLPLRIGVDRQPALDLHRIGKQCR